MARVVSASISCLLTGLLLGGCASARETRVGSTDQLLAALSHADPDEEILLLPGEYEDVNVRGFHGTATVRSADPARPAVLRGLTIDQSSGLVFEDLEMSTVGTPPGPAGVGRMVFRVLHSHDVTLRKLKVHGDPNGALATDISGILIRWSDHVTVEDSEFVHLHNGLQHADSEHITIRNNHFHLLWDDGIRGGGSSYVLIENNLCESQHPDPADIDHPDCIQFWTANTTAAAHDITIRGNRYRRGSGMPVQGIFVRDDRANLPFRNLVITGNDIEGGLWNGISVMSTEGPVLENNRVCRYRDQDSWIVVRDTKGAVVRNNKAPLIHYVNASHVTQDHNATENRCEMDKARVDSSAETEASEAKRSR